MADLISFVTSAVAAGASASTANVGAALSGIKTSVQSTADIAQAVHAVLSAPSARKTVVVLESSAPATAAAAWASVGAGCSGLSPCTLTSTVITGAPVWTITP
jgi:hypothetical protein